jgi:hypothetical protein
VRLGGVHIIEEVIPELLMVALGHICFGSRQAVPWATRSLQDAEEKAAATIMFEKKLLRFILFSLRYSMGLPASCGSDDCSGWLLCSCALTANHAE